MTAQANAELRGRGAWQDAVLNRPVLASALGNFVVTYDLVLFSIVRIPSLSNMGVSGHALLETGFDLLDIQMIGMLLGGIFWGVLADKLGRLPVLFAAPALYSIVNIYNAYVTTVDTYTVLRFLAGFGMAGELGAVMTIVSEMLPRETRGYSTSFVAGVGVMGAILAAIVTEHTDWETTYLVGGVLGLFSLAARLPLGESTMYERLRLSRDVQWGRLVWLVNSKERLRRLVHCVLLGMPSWFLIGILVTFSPEICAALGAESPVSAADGVIYYYIGLTLGCFVAGWLSQTWRSRRRALGVLVGLTSWIFIAFVLVERASPGVYYGMFTALGLFSGYWALFVSIPAEQFGTNLRGTATVLIPNIIRGSVVVLTAAVHFLSKSMGLVNGVAAVGAACFALSLIGIWRLPESFGRDLDFIER
ncbi:MAG: MFS transporter [Deltaproteobacteria bacterium]|nr:MFS transporter [Deltaproteobacteria bacterium]